MDIEEGGEDVLLKDSEIKEKDQNATEDCSFDGNNSIPYSSLFTSP